MEALCHGETGEVRNRKALGWPTMGSMAKLPNSLSTAPAADRCRSTAPCSASRATIYLSHEIGAAKANARRGCDRRRGDEVSRKWVGAKGVVTIRLAPEKFIVQRRSWMPMRCSAATVRRDILGVVALLKRTPNPSDAEITSGMNGHLAAVAHIRGSCAQFMTRQGRRPGKRRISSA